MLFVTMLCSPRLSNCSVTPAEARHVSEVLVQFETILAGPNGSQWAPRACGRPQADGMWEGWVEFEPVSSSHEVRRTPRESLQPNRDDLAYWAQGLTQTYLEGALQRALRPVHSAGRVAATSALDEPAEAALPRERIAPAAVLNPFDVYRQGEHVLVGQLAAMSAARLRDIAVAYGFASPRAADDASAESLASMILDGVRDPRRPIDIREE